MAIVFKSKDEEIAHIEHKFIADIILSFYKDALAHKNTLLVADVGSGSGEGTVCIAEKILQADFYAIDNNPLAIELGRKNFSRPNVRYVLGNFLETNLAKEGFDVVVSAHAIEHFSESDQKIFFQNVRRILKPGGLLVISTPDREVMKAMGIEGSQPDHIRELSKKEFIDLVVEGGFVVKDVYGQGFLKENRVSVRPILNIAKKFDFLRLRRLLSKKVVDLVDEKTQPISLDFTPKKLLSDQCAYNVIIVAVKN